MAKKVRATKQLMITAKFRGERATVELVREETPADMTLTEVRSRFRSTKQASLAKRASGCCRTQMGSIYKNGIVASPRTE